jgi:hypothetical protein
MLIQFAPLRKRNRSMQQGELIDVCSETHIKFITTVWGQNAEFFYNSNMRVQKTTIAKYV